MFTTTPKLAGIVAAAAFLLMEPAAFAAGPHKSDTAASKAAAIKALQRRSVDLDAAYRKLYPGAYRQAVRKNVEAGAWRFPSCTPTAAADYDPYTYSGDPCTSTAPAASTVGTIVLSPAIESGVVSPCNGSEEYDYIFSGEMEDYIFSGC